MFLSIFFKTPKLIEVVLFNLGVALRIDYGYSRFNCTEDFNKNKYYFQKRYIIYELSTFKNTFKNGIL